MPSCLTSSTLCDPIHSFWTIELAAEKGRERERGSSHPQIRQIASINEIEKRIDPADGRGSERAEISGFHRSLKDSVHRFSPRCIGPFCTRSLESGGLQLQVTSVPPSPMREKLGLTSTSDRNMHGRMQMCMCSMAQAKEADLIALPLDR